MDIMGNSVAFGYQEELLFTVWKVNGTRQLGSTRLAWPALPHSPHSVAPGEASPVPPALCRRSPRLRKTSAFHLMHMVSLYFF